MVRVQCSLCGASGKSIAYQSASALADDQPADQPADRPDDRPDDKPGSAAEAAVRAETCDACHGYRKILYEEKDIAVDPLADDLATLSLDLLLGESGYHRANSNPLLWQAGGG